ncbi:hypothetical protein [Alteribacter aurantiacus]|uniref:hypothetical protein n=1 Tax=Alteribacter aurantiacus TaxID=254410 RepID=UPI00040CD348|nr:hypothetical protein [Alteribacter aurantiacus]
MRWYWSLVSLGIFCLTFLLLWLVPMRGDVGTGFLAVGLSLSFILALASERGPLKLLALTVVLSVAMIYGVVAFSFMFGLI